MRSHVDKKKLTEINTMYTPVVTDLGGQEWVTDGLSWGVIGGNGPQIDNPKYYPTRKDVRKLLVGGMSGRGWKVWMARPEEYERYRIEKVIQG